MGLILSTLSRIFPSKWILNSGASHHMSFDHKSFLSLNPISSSIKVKIADGTLVPVAGIGSVSTSNYVLSKVYYVPKITMNVVSVSQLYDSGYSVRFSSTRYVQDPLSKRLVGKGSRKGGLYILDELRAPDTTTTTSITCTCISTRIIAAFTHALVALVACSVLYMRAHIIGGSFCLLYVGYEL
jgi:hypothetical protein